MQNAKHTICLERKLTIKKSKRLHQLYQDWLKIKEIGTPEKFPTMFDRPMAGKWYYTYSNDKGDAVGLAKLQNHLAPFDSDRKWTWETCTANEEMELRRFPTQKAAEVEIYKFLA